MASEVDNAYAASGFILALLSELLHKQCLLARLKILRQLSLLVSLQESAKAGLWLKLSPTWNGQGTSKEAYLGLVLENSYSYGTASWELF